MNPPAPFPGTEPPCSRADAVLAVHLDGDLDDASEPNLGYAFVDAPTLHEHLRACAHCQTTLRRARRLDALLARWAGDATRAHENLPGSSRPELQQRWFGAVHAAIAPVAATVVAADAGAATTAAIADGTSEGRTTWFAGGVLAIAACTGVLLLVHASRTAAAAAAAAAPHPNAPQVVATAALTAPAPLRSPAAAPTAAPTPPAAPVVVAPRDMRGTSDPSAGRHEAAPARRDPSLAAAATIALQVVHAAPAELAHRVADAARLSQDRLAATAALLAACRPQAPEPGAAFAALLEALAACGDHGTIGTLHRRQLELVRESPHALSLLHARLVRLDTPRATPAGATPNREDVAAIVVAARLDEPRCDAWLRRIVCRQPRCGDFVAMALRCGAREHGGAALLLDTWHDLALRGIAGDDAATARAWFGGQVASLLREVGDELRHSRSQLRRTHGLLALGAADGGGTLPELLAHVRSRHRHEAHVAAFALAQLPRDVLDDVAPLAADGDAWLLRAALARAGHAAAEPWLAAMTLRPAEQRLVRSASLAEFPEVASWFRERGAASDD
jgi:hypothetical protein